MAKRYGVMKVIIPPPHEVFDLEEVRTRVKGLGYIFVEYKTVEQAIFARKSLCKNSFRVGLWRVHSSIKNGSGKGNTMLSN